MVAESILELITGFYHVLGSCKTEEVEDFLEQAEESNFSTSYSVLNERVMMIDGYLP